MPGKIKSCREWDFKQLEPRRRTKLIGENGCDVIGLKVTASMFPGAKVGPAAACSPKIMGKHVEMEKGDEVVAEELTDAELTFSTKNLQGWRLSYGLHEPEKCGFEKYEK